MFITILEKYQKKIKVNIICFLFAFYIFFWGISFNFIQLRFLFLLLIIPILLSFSKIYFIKIFKYSIIPIILLSHLAFQASVLTLHHLFSVLGLYVIFIILDVYKKFFFSNLNRIIYFFLFAFFFFLVVQFFSYDNFFKQVSGDCIGCFSILRVFFKENSHLALIAPSTIFYLLFISNSHKFFNYFLAFIFFIICAINSSLTLIIGIIFLISLLFCLKVKFSNSQKTFLIILFFFILIKFITSSETKIKVLDFFTENSSVNLSTEVYKKSFLVAKKALFHKPLGYGFNNYSEAFEQFALSFDVSNKEVYLLNNKDASNNLSKIVTEFGVFSIFYIFFLIYFFFSKKIDVYNKIFLLLPILIQTFVRGAGYFNGGFLLFFFYCIYSLLKK